MQVVRGQGAGCSQQSCLRNFRRVVRGKLYGPHERRNDSPANVTSDPLQAAEAG